ncbi:MAG TPA: hypothetical protein ENF30_00655 [Candidatus Desulfofervidus auxilii]|uniref:Uncharacterized protein n=1 Tax=Desulfofervidus auxilii TaxID=1621989 RepID=A0A7V0I9R4_DESA2|nr:hypothetical protein [Candidatus Desulfofervidus auxilii]
MSEIKMTGEIRTDYDCEVVGLPAEMWAECLFKIEGEDTFHVELVAEENPVIQIVIGEVQWKGTLRGLKQLLQKQ